MRGRDIADYTLFDLLGNKPRWYHLVEYRRLTSPILYRNWPDGA